MLDKYEPLQHHWSINWEKSGWWIVRMDFHKVLTADSFGAAEAFILESEGFDPTQSVISLKDYCEGDREIYPEEVLV